MDVRQLTGADALVYILGVLLPVASLYLVNKTKIKEAEHRATVQEMEIKHLKQEVKQNATRLDGHDEQNRIMYTLIEQVKSLSSSVEEVKKDVKNIMKRGQSYE